MSVAGEVRGGGRVYSNNDYVEREVQPLILLLIITNHVLPNVTPIAYSCIKQNILPLSYTSKIRNRIIKKCTTSFFSESKYYLCISISAKKLIK